MKILFIWKVIKVENLTTLIWSKLILNSVGGFLIFNNSGYSLSFFCSSFGGFWAFSSSLFSPFNILSFNKSNVKPTF